MLKVECESCKAPYQIDERRVPPAGLKMRCPKCGHSFVVTNALAGGPARAPSPRTAQPTMAGIAPPPPPVASLRPPRPEPPSPGPSRTPLPSDFPAALGSLDESNLPVIAPGLPTHKPSAPKAPAAPTLGQPDDPLHAQVAVDRELDLPAVVAALPAARPESPKPVAPSIPSFELDLPAALSDLPNARESNLPDANAAIHRPDAASKGVELADLPSVLTDLPVPSAALPMVSASLPSIAASQPTFPTNAPGSPGTLRPPARSFGEIDLPMASESVFAPSAEDRHSPSLPPPAVLGAGRAQAGLGAPTFEEPRDPIGTFGELELPRESVVVPSRRANPVPSSTDSNDFGNLELDEKPSPSKASLKPAAVRPEATGVGMSFGEVQFGETQSPIANRAEEAMAGASASPAPPEPSEAVMPRSVEPQAAASARIARPRPALAARKMSVGRRLAGLALVSGLLGGAALQLTPYGAYGYLALEDLVHANDYRRTMAATMADTERALGVDTYDAAREAVESAAAAQRRNSRAKPLAAYAALVDFAMAVRFGPDTARASRGKQLLAALPPDEAVTYRDVALAAQAAAEGDLDKARKDLEAARQRDTGDPIQLEISLLRGEIELASRDGAAALSAFDRALATSNDARAHFGRARSRDLLEDLAEVRKEVEATLATSALHPGALTLRARARLKSSPSDDGQALKDLATVLEGPARPKASPNELSSAYALRARVSLERGGSSDARDAFGEAVKLDPRNVEALNGQGRLLLNEGRFTEALARFETALQIDPSSPETIANDAEAKIALERLGDAKQQLVAARQRFPKDIGILVLLGKVQQHLGDKDGAATVLRAAIGLVDPTRRDAVLPYVAMSELLSSGGQWAEARVVLDEARAKLPASAALDRAFGDMSGLQGDYDKSIAYYKSAIAKDPHDAGAHFRLGVALRKIRKFDEASAELDRVAAVDKDYPGLSLERGLLFEESGDVEKAIDQFKGALAKAPDDPDLQLRVGSAYVAIGRPESAIPMLRKVLEKRPTSAEAHHYLGRALMLQGPPQNIEALRNLKRAVDLDGNRAEYHVYVAWAANEATPAQLELARDEVDKALALDNLNAEAFWQKGVLERMEGAIEDAVKDEKRALELRPSRYEAHATIAECYQDRNDEAGAMSEWVKAIAGDGRAPTAETRHPYWHYKYGKLLAEHGNVGAALPFLLAAASTAEKAEQRPGWLAPLEFLTGEALRKTGRKADAIEHYRRFLEIAPASSPDRVDAQTALAQLNGKR